jgi:pimeloyl-ACP methyl ester carboxylesterase
VHFVHVRGRGPDSFPLLFCHGWPGSFWEVHKILGPLTDPASYGGDPEDAFDVVAPSLPGYGFSPHPGIPGLAEAQIGDLFDTLMTDALGYSRYGAQGGDWGAIITTCLGRDHSDSVAGIHLNMVAANPHVSSDEALTEAERKYLAKRKQWAADEGGYRHIQETKPQTLAAGLQDSPAGLAAWIAEKFRAWSDCGGDVESVFSKDDLLTNIMIYWVTETIATSVRLYFERRNNPARAASNSGYIETPTGFAKFPKEISDPQASGWKGRTTCSAGRSSPQAGISRRWRSHRSSSARSGSSSGRCGVRPGELLEFQSVPGRGTLVSRRSTARSGVSARSDRAQGKSWVSLRHDRVIMALVLTIFTILVFTALVAGCVTLVVRTALKARIQDDGTIPDPLDDYVRYTRATAYELREDATSLLRDRGEHSRHRRPEMSERA